MNSKMTTPQIRALKGQVKLVACTAYDYTFARLADELVDILLVGDSLGMVFQGRENTLSVTLDQIIYHTQAVARGARHAHVVADLPFMSYQVNAEEALRNSGRLISEGMAEGVKLEGGVTMAKTVERIVEAGIPVMGHIGLTPQSVHAMGGFKVQGKSPSARESLMQDALALEDAGVYAIVLEGIPSGLAKAISEKVQIPTIGIGAGVGCDGQVLVSTDLLGMNPHFKPKFLKHFAQVGEEVKDALQEFAQEVREGVFPDASHSFAD